MDTAITYAVVSGIVFGVIGFVLGFHANNSAGLGGRVVISFLIGLVFGSFAFGVIFLPYKVWSWATHRSTSHLVFAGKVVNERTGEWPNNRLVIVFQNEREVGRTTTQTGKFSQSNEGVHDGLFVIKVANNYLLNGLTLNPVFDKPVFGNLYHWFAELKEGSLTYISVPSKNIRYTIKVLSGDVATFPQALLTPGSATLTSDNNIVITLTGNPAVQAFTENSSAGEDVRIQRLDLNINEEMIEVDRVTVPMNNCGGSAQMSQEYSQKQTFIHEFHSELGGSAGLDIPLPFGWASLVLELQAQYRFTQGQVVEKIVRTNLAAEPGTNQKHTIVLNEVWETGSADIVTGNDIITIPFRVRTDLIHNIATERLDCN